MEVAGAGEREGRASRAAATSLSPADWLSSRLQAQSAASSGRGGGEERNIWSTSLFPPVASSPGRGEQKTDNCMIRGASSSPSSSRLQAGLAWCSVQPASLCGRAVHASEEPLSNPGLGDSLGSFFFFFLCLDSPQKNYPPSGQTAASLSASLRTQKADSQWGASSPGHGYSVVARLQPPAWQDQEAIDD